MNAKRPSKEAGGWKRTASLVLRIVIAAVGLTYVATTLTWTDSITLPADWPIDGHPVGEQARSFPVTQLGEQEVRFETPDGRIETLPTAALTQTEDGPQLDPGILTTLARADVALLAVALGLLGLVYLIQSFRWAVLMRCRSIEVTWYRAYRLTMVGAFFNTFMPGMTGGDIVKGYYAARGSGRTAATVVSVVADRAVGLLSLVMVGALAGLAAMDDPVAAAAAVKIWAIAAVTAAGLAMYFTQTLRKWLGVTRLLASLSDNHPLRRLDAAACAYREHRSALLGAMGLSLPVHMVLIIAIVITGYSLGVSTPFWTLVAVLPLILLAGALPLSFMGFGVMEPVGIALLGGQGATINQVVTMLVLARLYQICWSAMGAIYVVRGGLSLKEPQANLQDEPTELDARRMAP